MCFSLENTTYIQLYQLQILKRRHFLKEILSYLPFYCSRNSLQGKLVTEQGDQTFFWDQTGKKTQQKPVSYTENLFQIFKRHFKMSLEYNCHDGVVILKLVFNDEKKQGRNRYILDKELPLANQIAFRSTKLFLAPQSNSAHTQVALYRKYCSIVYMQYEHLLLITPQVRGQQ